MPQAGLRAGALHLASPGVFDYIAGDDTQFEREPLSRLAAAGELMAHRHEGFRQCMDTLKEAQDLNALCRRGAPLLVAPRGFNRRTSVTFLLFRGLIVFLEFLILFLDE